MGYIGKSDLEHRALAPFVASVDDAELTRLTEVYQAADEHIRALEARRDAARQEIAAIDEEIGNLDAPATDKALTQRGRLSGLLAGLQTALGKAQRKRVLANLAWLRRVRDVALAEAARLHAEIDPIMDQARDDRRAINARELAKLSREITEEQLAEEHAAYRTRQAERYAQTEAARSRLARTEEVVSVCDIRAQQQYGDAVRLTHSSTWEVAAAPTVRALVPAYWPIRTHPSRPRCLIPHPRQLGTRARRSMPPATHAGQV